ncbi:hypothetical protein QUA45_08885, partial [Microcoleus sp. Pol12A5]
SCTLFSIVRAKPRPRNMRSIIQQALFNERLEVKIWDMGEPFDLQAKLIEELPVIWSELGFMLD